MVKRIRFELKEKIVTLTGSCFWFWNSLYSFPKDSNTKVSALNIVKFTQLSHIENHKFPI